MPTKVLRHVATITCGVLLAVSATATAQADPGNTPTVARGTLEAAVSSSFAGAAVKLDRSRHGVRVPRDSERGLSMKTARWTKSVRVGLPGTDTKAALAEGSAVFEEVAADTSLVVQPVDVSATPEIESAVRTLVTIESAAAPSRYEFPLDLPARTTLQELPDGSVAVVDRSGGVIGGFASPWAVDAAGARVATRFSLEGDVLVQTIDHQGAAYPVVADPFWFIPAIIVGVRAIAPIIVKAATKKAAQKLAAKAAAKVAAKQGKKVKSLGGATKATFYTARGKIKPGVQTKKNGHSSFKSFKDKYGNRKDFDWHHIVEQQHIRSSKKFSAKSIHNPNNLVQVPKAIHQKCVNSIMGSRATIVPGLTPVRGYSLRQTLALGTFQSMHRAGVKILRFCGVKI